MEVCPEDSSVTLAPRLAGLGADLLVETMRGLEHGEITPVPQDNSRATLAPILTKEDGLVDFSRTAAQICNRLRGFQPWPGAYTQLRGKNLKIIEARSSDTSLKLAEAEMRVSEGKLFAGCGADTVLELLQVQPEAKKPISARDFIIGYRPAPGERLG
jgi:methionyl-tRNA formyltransferase